MGENVSTNALPTPFQRCLQKSYLLIFLKIMLDYDLVKATPYWAMQNTKCMIKPQSTLVARKIFFFTYLEHSFKVCETEYVSLGLPKYFAVQNQKLCKVILKCDGYSFLACSICQ